MYFGRVNFVNFKSQNSHFFGNFFTETCSSFTWFSFLVFEMNFLEQYSHFTFLLYWGKVLVFFVRAIFVWVTCFHEKIHSIVFQNIWWPKSKENQFLPIVNGFLISLVDVLIVLLVREDINFLANDIFTRISNDLWMQFISRFSSSDSCDYVARSKM